MATEMTPQERAEQIVKSVFTDNERGWRDWYAVANSGSAQQPVPKGTAQRLVDAVALEITQARRAALLEAAQVIRERAEFIAHDYDIEPIGELGWFERERIVQAAEDFITQLDRLAQEG